MTSASVRSLRPLRLTVQTAPLRAISGTRPPSAARSSWVSTATKRWSASRSTSSRTAGGEIAGEAVGIHPAQRDPLAGLHAELVDHRLRVLDPVGPARGLVAELEGGRRAVVVNLEHALDCAHVGDRRVRDSKPQAVAAEEQLVGLEPGTALGAAAVARCGQAMADAPKCIASARDVSRPRRDTRVTEGGVP